MNSMFWFLIYMFFSVAWVKISFNDPSVANLFILWAMTFTSGLHLAHYMFLERFQK